MENACSNNVNDGQITNNHLKDMELFLSAFSCDNSPLLLPEVFYLGTVCS